MHARIVCLCVLLLAQGAARAASPIPEGTIQVDDADLVWRPGPATMPAGVETVVLEGDPRQAGIFTLRLRAPAGTRLAPHTHPQPERVTVLQGAIGVGFGRHFEPGSLRVFRAGDYYVNPPGAAHFASFVEDAVLQVTGQGPWGVDFLPP